VSDTKKSFKYTYTRPSLDWFEYVDVEIKPDDYYYFKLNRRFGPSWWLIGTNPVDEPTYHWKETEIGKINEEDLVRFIKWAETDIGNKITSIDMICGSFNVFEETEKILKPLRKSGWAPQKYTEELFK